MKSKIIDIVRIVPKIIDITLLVLYIAREDLTNKQKADKIKYAVSKGLISKEDGLSLIVDFRIDLDEQISFDE